jgi:benzoyl-CoA reductase/2-hydroxyglutaryl-CoA dehydratase subunit BcrC/BadD/HgdB
MTWKEKCRRDPDLAESIIEALQNDLKEAEKRCEKLEIALMRIVNFDHWSTYKMREEAKEALK